MNREDLYNNFPPYIIHKTLDLLEKISSCGNLCTMVCIGPMQNVYILFISQHTFGRIQERLKLYNRSYFLHEIAQLLEKNVNLGKIVDDDVDKIKSGEEFHKLCLYYELLDWFIYFHIYDDGKIELSTVVNRKKTYFVDPNATAVWLTKSGNIVEDMKNIPIFAVSLNTKYDKQHRKVV